MLTNALQETGEFTRDTCDACPEIRTSIDWHARLRNRFIASLSEGMVTWPGHARRAKERRVGEYPAPAHSGRSGAAPSHGPTVPQLTRATSMSTSSAPGSLPRASASRVATTWYGVTSLLSLLSYASAVSERTDPMIFLRDFPP
jgi:hypothetical protein